MFDCNDLMKDVLYSLLKRFSWKKTSKHQINLAAGRVTHNANAGKDLTYKKEIKEPTLTLSDSSINSSINIMAKHLYFHLICLKDVVCAAIFFFNQGFPKRSEYF